MRKLNLGKVDVARFPIKNMNDVQRSLGDLERQTMSIFSEIQQGSHEQNIIDIANGFSIDTYTETRTLDPATATTQDIGNFLGTLLADMKKGGVLEP